MEYYDLLEQVQYSEDLNAAALANLETRLQQMITIEPDYLDPYLLLYRVNMLGGKVLVAGQILDKAYKRSLELITDSEGNWPDLMEWGWQENRPIIRTLMQKAENLWIESLDGPNRQEEAKEIYSQLLRVNPNDNAGARYPLLALLEGMNYAEYDSGFLGENEHDVFEKWFVRASKKHPEFDAWRNYIAQNT